MIKAVFFDLDGTLCYTLKDLCDAVNYALGFMGCAPHKLEEFNPMVGDGIPTLIKRALPDTATDADNKKALKLFNKYYAEHCTDNTYAYDGMCETVASLKKKGYKLGVLTNKNQAFAEMIVKHFYPKMFDVIIGHKPSLPKKPDPTGAFMLAGKFHVNTDECVIVGDSANDMVTASECGAISIGVLWGFRDETEIRGAGARFVCTKPSEIESIIDNINK